MNGVLFTLPSIRDVAFAQVSATISYDSLANARELLADPWNDAGFDVAILGDREANPDTLGWHSVNGKIVVRWSSNLRIQDTSFWRPLPKPVWNTAFFDDDGETLGSNFDRRYRILALV